jgi:hypothetical protein
VISRGNKKSGCHGRFLVIDNNEGSVMHKYGACWSGRIRKFVIAVVITVVCILPAFSAAVITGVARNRTRGRDAAGDRVILLRLVNPMKEEDHAVTDANGAFSLGVRYPKAAHLVRVLHQGVSYDIEAAAGDAVSIDVFDVAAKVQNLMSSVEVFRIGTKGDHLHVSDMIAVRNNSNPPVTEAGERTFEVYLPPHAVIASVLAAGTGSGSGKIGAMISAKAVPGEPGHYSVNFPLRPGSTEFAFNYDLPYSGHAMFHTRSMYPVQQLVVMTPPPMRFAARSAAFHTLPTGNDRYQTVATGRLEAGVGPSFEISGMGELPSAGTQAQAPAKQSTAVRSMTAPSSGNIAFRGRNDRERGLGEAAFVPSHSKLSPGLRMRWWGWFSGAVLSLGAVWGFLLRKRQRESASGTRVRTNERRVLTPASMIESLNDELCEVEIDRSLGTISAEEYASASYILKRGLMRASARGGSR